MSRESPPAPDAIRPFSFPSIVRETHPNGLAFLCARHGTLPVVTVEVVLRAGATEDPPAADGLAHLTAAALDSGTRTREGEQLAWALESIGVELETAASWDAITLRATASADRLEDTVALLAEITREPRFPAAEVDRLREEQRAEILQNAKEPRALAEDAFNRFVFASKLRYARPLLGTASTVAGIEAEHAAEFHAQRFVPAAAAVIFAGDVDAAHASRLVGRYFGEWQGHGAAPATFEVRPHANAAMVHVVDRSEAVQSEIRVGHPTVSRAHPDHLPLRVLNTVLGGAFTSRLNLNLRERHGYTYGVRSVFAHRRIGGRFAVATAVATAVTAPATEQILYELRRMHEEGVTEVEVGDARDYLTGTTPLQVQTAGQVADRLASLFIYQLPDDYYDRAREIIGRVSAADVARVAHEHLRPDRLALVVVGRAVDVEDGLRGLELGPVHIHPAPQ